MAPSAPLDDDMIETRPMPKRTRDDFQSLYRLSAIIDAVPMEATPWQVASQCATATAEALQAHAVVIHQLDGLRRELRTIGVHGPNAGDLLGTFTKIDDDYVATAVLTNAKALMLHLDGALPRFVPERHRLLGTSRSLAVFPVFGADGCMAIIEVVGVGAERQQGITDACRLVAQRLIASLAARPPAAPDQATKAAPPAPANPRRFVGSSRREARTVNATPATFPKRAATLQCRLAH